MVIMIVINICNTSNNIKINDTNNINFNDDDNVNVKDDNNDHKTCHKTSGQNDDNNHEDHFDEQ